MNELAARYRDIRERVRSAAQKVHVEKEPVLIAVSKTQPPEAIEALHALGHRQFGENYVQELIAKAELLRERGIGELEWHFIGHLQTNKVKALIPWVSAIHTVDSLRLATESAKRWRALGRAGRLPVFIEVNLEREPSKSGLAPEEVPELARAISEKLPELELRGLMAIPKPGSGPSTFASLRELERSCRPWTDGQLSMGMSQDFEQAIAEGATHVRIGSAIFKR
jgi:pyridoxal phosphate enzyme (YggS family)